MTLQLTAPQRVYELALKGKKGEKRVVLGARTHALVLRFSLQLVSECSFLTV